MILAHKSYKVETSTGGAGSTSVRVLVFKLINSEHTWPQVERLERKVDDSGVPLRAEIVPRKTLDVKQKVRWKCGHLVPFSLSSEFLKSYQ